MEPPVRRAGPLFTRLAPQPLPAPYWVGRSRAVAHELGLSDDWMASQAALEALTGNLPLACAPLASVYSGQPPCHWAGQLGDGRPSSIGEIVTPEGGGMELQPWRGRTPSTLHGYAAPCWGAQHPGIRQRGCCTVSAFPPAARCV